MILRSVSLALLLLVFPIYDADARLLIQFEEDAPRDRIRVDNQTNCPLGPFVLEINLSGSAGALIFDTLPAGPGLNVAQPFQVAKGAEFVTRVAPLQDGDQRAAVAFAGMGRKAEVVFTADLDDRVPTGPLGSTMIAPSELAGASARAVMEGATSYAAVFDASGRAALDLPSCVPVT